MLSVCRRLFAITVFVLTFLEIHSQAEAQSSTRPRISGSANGAGIVELVKGWPILLRVRLSHPQLMHFSSTVEPITIASQSAYWSSAISLAVENTGGQIQNWPFQQVVSASESKILLDAETTGQISWVLSPEFTLQIPPGEYKVMATLDTRNAADALAWKGKVFAAPLSIKVLVSSALSPSDEEGLKFNLLAMYELWRGDSSRAILHLEELLTKQPGNVSGLELRAELYEKAGKVREAFQDYNEAIKQVYTISPNPPEPPAILLRKRLELVQEFFSTPTSVAEDIPIPDTFHLHQNFPNPFNPITTIRFELPVRSRVKLVIYNLLGQLVKTLVDEEKSAGVYEASWVAERFASGVYLYRLEAQPLSGTDRSPFFGTGKILLLK